MERRWNIPDSVFELSLKYHKAVLNLLLNLPRSTELENYMNENYSKLNEISDLLLLEWRRSFPITAPKPKELTSMPILN
jgi:hypothetical protein